MNYPAFEELNIAPDYLWIGASAIRNLCLSTAPLARVTPEKRKHAKSDARCFVSRYVGVTRTQGHYVGQWRNERGTYSRGPRRPDTPAGELQAAWDWARATGKTALEER